MRSGLGKLSDKYDRAKEVSLSSSSLFFGCCFIFFQHGSALLPGCSYLKPRRLRIFSRFLLNRASAACPEIPYTVPISFHENPSIRR